MRAFTRQHGASKSFGIPEIEHVAQAGEGLQVDLSLYEREAGDLVLDLAAINPQAMRIDETEVRVFDRHGERIDIELWHWDERGQPLRDQHMTVNGYETAKATLHIPNADKREIEPMRIEFHGMKGGTSVMTSLQVGTFRPMTPKEVEQQRREQERLRKERERREKAKGVMVSARALGGAAWLGNVLVPSQSQAARVGGVGVRVTKGLSPLWAFEVEIAGAQTSMVRFDGMTWNGMDGDLTRRATLGRILIGGQLRFGDRYKPFARAGVGFQGVIHDSGFMPAGGAQETGPNAPFQLDMIAVVGGGLNIRMSRQWVAGVSMTGSAVMRNIGGEGITGSLEAGIYMGYVWGR